MTERNAISSINFMNDITKVEAMNLHRWSFQSYRKNVPQELTATSFHPSQSWISSEIFFSHTIPVQTVELTGAMTELFPLLQFQFVLALAASPHTGQAV